MVPTIDQLEQYFDYVERLVVGTLAAASPGLPNVQEALNRLWLDISRFGPPGLPSFPDIRVPGLRPFEVPPPPPPPPPKSLIDNAGDCIARHPWIVSGVAISALGAGLLAGYSIVCMRSLKGRRVKVASPQFERRQAVVILGGDHPLGLPLIMEFEKQGYIVITSVSSPETVSDIESKGHGYVRALILDPSEPGTIPIFLRSLASTLSRRFPITAAGDPYAPTPYHPMVHSVISLLTMPTASVHCAPAPFEQISLRSTYLPHLLSTHVAPLQVIQALLPLLRADASRARGHKSIILCLPAADARVGLPFGSVNAMSAAATLRAADVLRREIAAAQGMSAIRIVTVDVGAVGSSTGDLSETVNMDDWTPSEKATYGAALSALRETRGSRVPADVSTFVDSLVSVASGGTKARYSGKFVFGIGFGLVYEQFKDWVRGDRFSIGAGAGTYAIASYLPPVLLDSLLALPHFLMTIRNRLLPPLPPRTDPPSNRTVRSTTPASHPENVPGTGTSSLVLHRPVGLDSTISEAAVTPESHPNVEEEGTSPDAEAESNDGDLESTSVGSSWVSLGPHE
ncbi:hypothetical protein L210DRAFT_3619274 [Boletus edulis BED1]|uniref:DUF1776-domain-containing protein n=1 Tax=Boletus edulis BED1 TaxID=1328754 RepID=A0AAD4C3H6_BOLED|nr:hypothetical protein L210DRAFT_3619274 [Boletus edulis BED1]